MNITVWNEFVGQNNDAVRAAYPHTLQDAVAQAVAGPDAQVVTATLEDPHQGLSDELLNRTDVLFWWGHMAHDRVDDALVQKIVDRVHRGMGMIFLHSAHMAKPFRALMGTSCTLGWREGDEREHLWTIDPTHPICKGVPACVTLPHEETYAEPFDIPAPDETVFIGWFRDGHVFRSGVTYKRGRGKIFYFQPGHETHPTYYDPAVKTILYNAARWAYNPDIAAESPNCPNIPPIEK